ncbi:Alpha/Beta hydrolase protein [Scheffersomyces xylosifermentans]|uniref:Alpha/Beta hydrolase protein n=1 Tax=Scheffersomyces xylosifermentans TaxID=1304137 RepID=UPI00315D6FDE
MSAPQVNFSIIPKNRFVALENGVTMFYREAGEESTPNLLLLHGLPTSSRQYKNLISLLAPHFHIVAPDLPGYGQTKVPEDFVFSFAAFADYVELLLDAIKFDNFAVYVFDYGAPTGFRLAIKRTKKITAFFAQNGNAYVEGLDGAFWDNIKKAWALADLDHLTDEQKLESERLNKINSKLVTDVASYSFQYDDGEGDATLVDPEAALSDYHFLTSRPNYLQEQLDILVNYRTNVDLYPDFQQYFRETNVPILAVWGKNDKIFIPSGAHAYKKDSKNVKVIELDAGHFSSNSHAPVIAQAILDFSAEYNLLK